MRLASVEAIMRALAREDVRYLKEAVGREQDRIDV
jgi:hypothetical protein